MSTVLEGMTIQALREQLEWVEHNADLAQFIDSWPRAQREQRQWLTIAAQIKDEIGKRQEKNWKEKGL